MRATRSHTGHGTREKPLSNEREPTKHVYVRLYDYLDNGSRYEGNGPEYADKLKVKQPVHAAVTLPCPQLERVR